MIEGTHRAYVETTELGESARKGTPCVMVKFRVQPGSGEEELMPHNIWLTEKSMSMARKQLATMGFDIDKRDLSDLDEDPTLLNGNEVEVVVEEEEYNGRSSLKIKYVNSPGIRKKKWGAAAVKSMTDALREAREEDEVEESAPF